MKIFLSILLLFSFTSFAQVTQEWVATYNGSNVLWGQFVNSIAVDGLGNSYIIAVRDSGINSDKDYTILKYNQDGEEQWHQHYDGPGNGEDIPNAIEVDESGNVYVTGHSKGTGTLLDFATIKYNTDGVQQWVRRYNGTGNGNDRAKSITVDGSGNVYVIGESDGSGTSIDYATIKYSSDGTEAWAKRFNGAANENDLGYRIAVDVSGNVYATGSSSSGSGQDYDFATVKYSPDGDQKWVKVYDGPASGEDNPFDIAVDEAGNVYLAGESEGVGTFTDYATIKYNTTGGQLWVKHHNGTGNSSDFASSIAVDSWGNVIVTGTTWGFANTEYTTIKYNSDGVQQWSRDYSRTGSSDDFARSIAVDGSGNAYVTGESVDIGLEYDYATIKYNFNGDEVWNQSYNGIENLSDQAKSITLDGAGNVYVTGYTVLSENDYKYTTIKYSSPRYPVLIVPGIAGTYAANVDEDLAWLVERGTSPENIQVDPLANVYKDLISTLENVGYEKNKDLFLVNYDWRLLPAPLDNNFDGFISGLSGPSLADDEFNYGVDYLGWYIKKACERWRIDNNEELKFVNIISHSTGGLVTRAYIQSNAYGDVYDAANNYKLAKIQDFIMIGVPNRGASKAWNPIHDNWIADPAYRFVLSKIINRAFQKVKKGYIINGPDYLITWGSILDSLGNPNKELFIKKYVPTVKGLLATFDFIDFGNGVTNVNNDSLLRNSLILDLNNGYDLYSNVDPNGFLDSTQVSVLYGVGKSTFNVVEERNDFEINAIQSFTDWLRTSVSEGSLWYNDFPSGENNGDETVPTVSAAGQFQNDSRAIKIPFTVSNHTGMVSTLEVQSNILDILNVNYDQSNISTGSSASFSNVLHVISDPVELFIIDGIGRRLGYSNSTGKITEIPNSSWFGNTEGMGYVFGSVQEPINLQLTGLGEDYYVMVSVEDNGNGGGVVLEGFLGLGEVINYQITLEPLSVDKTNTISPDEFTLAQNYPNPFNPVTTIQYSIPQSSNVKLKIYDVLGNEVATLANEEKERGVYTVDFDASQFSSGIYLYRLQAGSFIETKKMILLK